MTEYIGKLTYPASWMWSALPVLMPEFAGDLPGFIRSAIEFGLPTEAATRLVETARLTRSAALAVTSAAASSRWDDVEEWLRGDTALE